ncbi:hypothetical protein D4764_14G0000810 [Takifugu flavidus]|uniref:Uncharacterized protein n=1 Tax=Takifugu flavidus TaxID=433684 RepID=A0A5C6P792_9TELE|nr:hypothetical protein D4764_14G0000810 [Takifugu flavidus]
MWESAPNGLPQADVAWLKEDETNELFQRAVLGFLCGSLVGFLGVGSCSCVPVVLEDCSCSPCSLGGLPLPSVSRGTFVLRRTPESSPVQEDCSVLRTHQCSEFPAVQGDCVWFGESPMDLGRADAASRSPCGPGGLFLLMCAPLPCK